MKNDNYGRKIYMVIFLIMIFMITIFKMVYIRREYLSLSTDYSAYVLIFMPFVIYCALKHTGNISGAVSINWLCTIPMSLYLYQSLHLHFKQFDVLVFYSLLGIFVNLVVFKKAEIRELIPAVSGYILLNLLTVLCSVKNLISGLNGDNYEQYCVINIIKNAGWFGASDISGQYLDALYAMPGKGSKLYFIAEKTAQYGIANTLIVYMLIIGLLGFLFFINYKRNDEIALVAAAILIVQSICFLLVNLGVLRGTVYEIVLLKKNVVYSICQLMLIGIALDIKRIRRYVCRNEK